MNATQIVSSVRQALTRVADGSVVTLTRAEFETLAAAVEARPAPRKTPPEVTQAPLPLFPKGEPKLPAGLKPDQFSKLLERPKTVATLARETKLSKGSIKRALAAMPGVHVVRAKVRAHQPGRRAHVYSIH